MTHPLGGNSAQGAPKSPTQGICPVVPHMTSKAAMLKATQTTNLSFPITLAGVTFRNRTALYAGLYRLPSTAAEDGVEMVQDETVIRAFHRLTGDSVCVLAEKDTLEYAYYQKGTVRSLYAIDRDGGPHRLVPHRVLHQDRPSRAKRQKLQQKPGKSPPPTHSARAYVVAPTGDRLRRPSQLPALTRKVFSKPPENTPLTGKALKLALWIHEVFPSACSMPFTEGTTYYTTRRSDGRVITRASLDSRVADISINSAKRELANYLAGKGVDDLSAPAPLPVAAAPSPESEVVRGGQVVAALQTTLEFPEPTQSTLLHEKLEFIRATLTCLPANPDSTTLLRLHQELSCISQPYSSDPREDKLMGIAIASMKEVLASRTPPSLFDDLRKRTVALRTEYLDSTGAILYSELVQARTSEASREQQQQ